MADEKLAGKTLVFVVYVDTGVALSPHTYSSWPHTPGVILIHTQLPSRVSNVPVK
jgi:hypothetical protein